MLHYQETVEQDGWSCYLVVRRCVTVWQLYRLPLSAQNQWSTARVQAAVIYCPSNQRDSLASEWLLVVFLDAGDSGADERGVKMISESQVHVLNAGESVVLDCYFNAATYNMFDYPLLWKKVSSTLLMTCWLTKTNVIITPCPNKKCTTLLLQYSRFSWLSFIILYLWKPELILYNHI